jgi:hypothetical protein
LSDHRASQELNHLLLAKNPGIRCLLDLLPVSLLDFKVCLTSELLDLGDA